MLSEYYGVRGTALKWFESYLENHKFYISINENKSTSRDLQFSVPQGSCAAPSLFGIYCSTLQEIIPKERGPDSYQSNGTRKQRAWCAPSIDSTFLNGFADDHSLNKGFRPDHVEEVSMISKLEGTLANINSWMGENCHKMNNSKTDFLYVASHHQLQKCEIKEISVCGENVPRSDFIQLLGAWIDKNLNMKQHIMVKCKITMWNVQKIKHIRKYLTQEAAQLLASIIVMSHLDYANSLLYGLPECNLDCMQWVQNIVGKIVINESKYSSSTEMLKTLHWLPIDCRIEYKLLILVHNCLDKSAPSYLIDLLRREAPNWSRLRSENLNHILQVPHTTKKTFADRSFGVVGPKLCNNIPDWLRCTMEPELFRKKLKTYFFKWRFNC